MGTRARPRTAAAAMRRARPGEREVLLPVWEVEARKAGEMRKEGSMVMAIGICFGWRVFEGEE
jgi:hypothetical protein